MDALLRRKEFVLARDQAASAIATGAHEAAALVPLYRVLAIATSSIGDGGDAARRAFLWLLALDPDFRLGDEWPVEVRSPYMEARGDASMHGEALSASGRLAADETAWLVQVNDPFQLAARVRLRVRFAGQQDYLETVRVPAAEVSFPLPENPDDRALEYSLSLLDEHGNRVWQRGTDDAPEVFPYTAPPSSSVVVASKPPAQSAQSEKARSRFFVAATTSLIVAGAAAMVGGFQHVERQRLAKRWNEGACQGRGDTRAEVCREERRGIDQAQRLAGTAYAIAGVGLVTSLLLFIARPSRQEEQVRNGRSARLRCADGPGTWGVACAANF